MQIYVARFKAAGLKICQHNVISADYRRTCARKATPKAMKPNKKETNASTGPLNKL